MSLQSERLLNHMLRLRLSHLPNCFEAIAEEASAKNLPYLDFLEQALEAESQAKHTRNVRLKTQWAHFPYTRDWTSPTSTSSRRSMNASSRAGWVGLSGTQGERVAARSARGRQTQRRLTISKVFLLSTL